MVRDEVVLTPTHPKQAVAYEPPMTAHVHHDEPVHGGAFIPPQPERAVLRPARMPRVDELPVPAQNQIRASRGEEAGQDHKRMTLLQRLATVGFGRKDEAPAPVHAPLEPPPQAHRQNHEAPRQAASPVHAEYAKERPLRRVTVLPRVSSIRKAACPTSRGTWRTISSRYRPSPPGELTLRSLLK